MGQWVSRAETLSAKHASGGVPETANASPCANDIVHGSRRVTANTALRLGRFFGTSPELWLGLQMDYELDAEQDRLGRRLEAEVRQYRPAG